MKQGQRKRTIYYVCASLINNKLITQLIPADSTDQAIEKFKLIHNCQPQDILGPFYKKKTYIVENTRVLKFKKDSKLIKAVYNDWCVNAFELQEPEAHAFLIFVKKVDGSSAAAPKGTVIVPFNDLRIQKW